MVGIVRLQSLKAFDVDKDGATYVTPRSGRVVGCEEMQTCAAAGTIEPRR